MKVFCQEKREEGWEMKEDVKGTRDKGRRRKGRGGRVN
jgi:hypothetical protein